MRNEENGLRGTHIKIPANRPYGHAGIFMCVPLRPFSSFCIGSALQGVPWALPRPPLTLQGTQRDPRGGNLVPATIFVSDDICVVKMHDLIMMHKYVHTYIVYYIVLTL